MIRLRSSRSPILVAVLGALTCACASTTPPELTAAQHAYKHAIASQAPALAPKELEVARKALLLAEAAHSEEIGGPVPQTLGYVAERRAEEAEAIAGAVAADKQRARAEAEVEAGLTELRERMAVRQKHEETARQAQEAAAQKADTALEGLGKFATVTRATRGIVVNVPGAALFIDGQPRISSSGLQHIDEIADAIRLQPDRRIVVQGYSDARRRGQDLARHRAQAVRDELVSRGVPADRVRTENAIEPGLPTEARSIDIVLEAPH